MLRKWLRALWLSIADAVDEVLLYPTSQDRKNHRICEAIRERRALAFSYRGGRRCAEPFCLGLVHRGTIRNESLLCYQTGGYAALVEAEGWKLYRARDIKDLAVAREEFAGDRPGYDPDRIPMYRVYCRVMPARRWPGPAAESVEELLHGFPDETAREKVRLPHNDLMHLFRNLHPEAVPDLADVDDVGELADALPENAEPAPRDATPAPEERPADGPSA